MNRFDLFDLHRFAILLTLDISLDFVSKAMSLIAFFGVKYQILFNLEIEVFLFL